MSALPPKADIGYACRDVRFVPCVDGSELARRIFTSQSWSVQPCVRPLSAVHMTAGHNALRGSSPGQKPAFDDAVAQVGCPDRRIDGSALRAVRPPNRCDPVLPRRRRQRAEGLIPTVIEGSCNCTDKCSWISATAAAPSPIAPRRALLIQTAHHRRQTRPVHSIGGERALSRQIASSQEN